MKTKQRETSPSFNELCYPKSYQAQLLTNLAYCCDSIKELRPAFFEVH